MSPTVFLLGMLHSLLAFVGWVVILVTAIVRWSDTRLYLREGVILGVLFLVLSLPGTILSAVFLDLSKMLPPNLVGVGPMLGALASVMSFVFLLVGAVHIPLKAAVASMATPERSPFPLLSGRGERYRGWTVAVAIGGIAGVISIVVFDVLGIKAGSAFQMFQMMFPGLSAHPRPLVVLASIPALIAAAVYEEILYRGVLQAWLVRWLGDSSGRVAASIALTSIVWAVAHAANADPMLPKLIQIVLLGFLFGGLARRYSVEASIMAHIALNVMAAIGGVLFETP
jgi:membrane protease YdiL (CAAX protease family)